MHPRDAFWVVTCRFDPAGFETPRRNYRLFAESLIRQGVRLLTVELLFPGQASSVPDLGEPVVQLRGGNDQLLWQKERLLTYAISLLPPSVPFVAWADADLLWPDNWAQSAYDALRRYDVVQLFDRCHRLQKGCVEIPRGEMGEGQPGSVSHFRSAGPDPANKSHPGFAWAARRRFLNEVGLYEHGVMGSGDLYFSKAVLGDAQWVYGYEPIDTHLRAWTARVRSYKPGVACLDLPVYHLHHGEIKHRRYVRRHDVLTKGGFCPLGSLRVKNHAWAWADPESSMAWGARDYFLSRREDG